MDATVQDEEVTVEEQSEPVVLFTQADAEKLIQEAFPEQFELGTIKPISLAKLAGVRNQMIYNYIGKGLIDHFVTADTEKMLVPLSGPKGALAFLQRYLNRKAVQQDKIDRQLRGEEG